MKIAFDHQVFTMQPYGGVSRYFTELAGTLAGMDEEVKVFAGLYQNQYLSQVAQPWVNGRFVNHFPKKTGRIFDLANHVWTQGQIKRFRPDVIHETYYSAYPRFSGNAPRVVTVYDMIHELFPESFKAKDSLPGLKKAALEKADHIISISQSTKEDVIRILGIPEEKITVIPLAVNPLPTPKKDVSLPISRPFLLYVGARKGYKNFSTLVKAYSQSPYLKKEFDLVAFGAGPFENSEVQLLVNLGLSSGEVKQISGSDEVLSWLYQHASAFIYPSQYEGFGLPPLEAMSHGCPVISSNTSSIPEVIGEAAEFFDPYSSEELQRAIETVVFSTQRTEELIMKGNERLNHFSWEKCASQTLEVYHNLITNHS